MEKTVRVAAAGDNCIDAYDNINQYYPGGNPVNVAVYIKRLGGDASYTGAVGTDESGELMIRSIREKGVDVSHIQVLEGNTAVSHVELVDGNRVFGDYEEGVLADFKLKPEDIRFLCSHDLVVTGIWGMIEGNLPEISRHVPVAFDFANKFASPVMDAAVPYVTYAFFSCDEESGQDFERRYQELGCPEAHTDMERLTEFMKAIKARGPKVVIVTLGEQGSVAFDGTEVYRCGVVSCDVVDTMGAGDSFIAGFLYGSLQGMKVPEAMEAGARNSAVTLGYFGAW